MSYALTALGCRIYVDPADPRSTELVAAAGDLNPRSLALWRLALAAHPWDLVIDIGVNYGEMLVGAEPPAGAKVVGFEPNLALHPFLIRTLEENGIPVDLRPAAVADRTGTARFAVDATWSGTSSLETGNYDDPERWRFLEVPVTTLDEVVGDPGRAFCVKVDVEGFERQVVSGGQGVLRPEGHWLLMLEVLHMAPDYFAELVDRYAVFLLDAGSSQLVRVAGDVPPSELLASDAVYPQDCLLVSEPIAAVLGQ